MNRNIIIGIVIVIIILVGAFFIFRGGPIDTSAFKADEAELDRFNQDIEAASQDSGIFNEFTQTFLDILDEVAPIPPGEALDEASINQDAAESDLSDSLDSFAADESALQEFDDTFEEVSQ
ncbi:MAG: hypothetical protein KJI71_04840 [Patescibacteria group bacterium]|nr:hypothetical protein [Patescibacteria group bacterium]